MHLMEYSKQGYSVVKILNLSGRCDMSYEALSIKDGSRRIVLREQHARSLNLNIMGGF